MGHLPLRSRPAPKLPNGISVSGALQTKEFFHYLFHELEIESAGMEIVSMHHKLNQILSREFLDGRHFVLAVDEEAPRSPCEQASRSNSSGASHPRG